MIPAVVYIMADKLKIINSYALKFFLANSYSPFANMFPKAAPKPAIKFTINVLIFEIT